MSTTAKVRNYIEFTGDIQQGLVVDSGDQANSPANSQVVTLSNGNNTITVPTVTGYTIHGLAIIPPDGNAVDATLKGVNGDTGVRLSASKATIIHFGAVVPASIVLSVTSAVNGFRLVWF